VDDERPAAVWVIAGAPGSGKSTVAELLLHRLDPVPALLDKDVLFPGFVVEVLAAHDRPFGEREGPFYDEHVKVHEYAGMTAAAAQIRSFGCPVLLVAPFTNQIRQPGRWQQWVAELGGEPVHLVWVRIDAELLHHRLVARGTDRDGGKLDDFGTFLGRMSPGTPPPAPHHEIDNTGSPAELADRVDALLSGGAPGSPAGRAGRAPGPPARRRPGRGP